MEQAILVLAGTVSRRVGLMDNQTFFHDDDV